MGDDVLAAWSSPVLDGGPERNVRGRERCYSEPGAGLGAEPLVIVGVVVSYIVSLRLSTRQPAEPASAQAAAQVVAAAPLHDATT